MDNTDNTKNTETTETTENIELTDITESNNESVNLILDETNTENLKNIKTNDNIKFCNKFYNQSKYLLFSYTWFFILVYIGIFILVPILQLIYSYNFNKPIICNVRFTNGTLYQFVNNHTNIGSYDAIDFVIFDGICELVFIPLIIIIHIIILKYKNLQNRKNILLITVILWINTLRYFSFEIIFVSYLINLYNTCTNNYIAYTNIQYIKNVSDLEDIIILRMAIGLLHFSAQCATALYYANVILKKFKFKFNFNPF